MAAFEQGMRETMNGDKFVDIRTLLAGGRKKVEEVCSRKIKLLTAYKE